MLHLKDIGLHSIQNIKIKSTNVKYKYKYAVRGMIRIFTAV